MELQHPLRVQSTVTLNRPHYGHGTMGFPGQRSVLQPQINSENQASCSRVFHTMLRTTTETGDIGAFSIRPRVPSTSRKQPANYAPYGYQPRQRQTAQSFGSSPDDRRFLPSYTREASFERSHGSGSMSQQSSVSSRTNNDNDSRSYSMTNASGHSNSLTNHRSCTSLRSQPDSGLVQRPRSPYPYPTRLKRPGFRPSSPVLTSNGVDYSRRAEIQRKPVGCQAISPLIPRKRVPPPLTLRTGANKSTPALRGHPSPRNYGYGGLTRANSSATDWIPRSEYALYDASPMHSPLSSGTVTPIRFYEHHHGDEPSLQRSEVDTPLYYDYTEEFEPLAPSKSVRSRTSSFAIENPIPEHGPVIEPWSRTTYSGPFNISPLSMNDEVEQGLHQRQCSDGEKIELSETITAHQSTFRDPSVSGENVPLETGNVTTRTTHRKSSSLGTIISNFRRKYIDGSSSEEPSKDQPATDDDELHSANHIRRHSEIVVTEHRGDFEERFLAASPGSAISDSSHRVVRIYADILPTPKNKVLESRRSHEYRENRRAETNGDSTYHSQAAPHLEDAFEIEQELNTEGHDTIRSLHQRSPSHRSRRISSQFYDADNTMSHLSELISNLKEGKSHKAMPRVAPARRASIKRLHTEQPRPVTIDSAPYPSEGIIKIGCNATVERSIKSKSYSETDLEEHHIARQGEVNEPTMDPHFARTNSPMLAPKPISPIRELRLKNSIPRLLKALPPLPALSPEPLGLSFGADLDLEPEPRHRQTSYEAKFNARSDYIEDHQGSGSINTLPLFVDSQHEGGLLGGPSRTRSQPRMKLRLKRTNFSHPRPVRLSLDYPDRGYHKSKESARISLDLRTPSNGEQNLEPPKFKLKVTRASALTTPADASETVRVSKSIDRERLPMADFSSHKDLFSSSHRLEHIFRKVSRHFSERSSNHKDTQPIAVTSDIIPIQSTVRSARSDQWFTGGTVNRRPLGSAELVGTPTETKSFFSDDSSQDGTEKSFRRKFSRVRSRLHGPYNFQQATRSDDFVARDTLRLMRRSDESLDLSRRHAGDAVTPRRSQKLRSKVSGWLKRSKSALVAVVWSR